MDLAILTVKLNGKYFESFEASDFLLHLRNHFLQDLRVHHICNLKLLKQQHVFKHVFMWCRFVTEKEKCS